MFSATSRSLLILSPPPPPYDDDDDDEDEDNDVIFLGVCFRIRSILKCFQARFRRCPILLFAADCADWRAAAHVVPQQVNRYPLTSHSCSGSANADVCKAFTQVKHHVMTLSDGSGENYGGAADVTHLHISGVTHLFDIHRAQKERRGERTAAHMLMAGQSGIKRITALQHYSLDKLAILADCSSRMFNEAVAKEKACPDSLVLGALASTRIAASSKLSLAKKMLKGTRLPPP